MVSYTQGVTEEEMETKDDEEESLLTMWSVLCTICKRSTTKRDEYLFNVHVLFEGKGENRMYE